MTSISSLYVHCTVTVCHDRARRGARGIGSNDSALISAHHHSNTATTGSAVTPDSLHGCRTVTAVSTQRELLLGPRLAPMACTAVAAQPAYGTTLCNTLPPQLARTLTWCCCMSTDNKLGVSPWTMLRCRAASHESGDSVRGSGRDGCDGLHASVQAERARTGAVPCTASWTVHLRTACGV